MKRIAFPAGRFSASGRFSAPLAPLAEPLRADFYADDAMAAMAKKIAAGQSGAPPFFTPLRPLPRLHDNARVILHAFRAADAAARQQESLSPATQWLLDNYYTIDKAIKQIRPACPRKLLRRLPPYPPLPALPRIFAFAWFYIAHADSNFSLKSLTAAVRAYQTALPLTIGELWILPAALRFVLVENARRIAAALEQNAAMRLKADKAADEIALIRKKGRAGTMESVLAKYSACVGDSGFSGRLLSRLENASVDNSAAIKWLHYKLAEAEAAADKNGGGRPAAEQSRQAANGVTMGNIIRAFKAIDDIDWPIWFESVCAVDRILRAGSDFSELDAPSRNAYRSAVESIAKNAPMGEPEVAEQAIKLAAAAKSRKTAAGQSAERENTELSAYLLGKKRPLLEKACHYKLKIGERLARRAEKLQIGAIALPVSALALLLIGAVYAFGLYSGLTAAKALLLAALFCLPAMEAAFAAFSAVVSWHAPPRRLVGYAYPNGIPPAARTLVAVPILISSRQSIDAQIRNLEVHYLSNSQGALHFALISDWKDAKAAETAEDRALLAYALAQTAALNRRYPPTYENGQAARFYFLHRRRLWNAGENCFMGWERKRGKLHELNRLLRGAKDTNFLPPATPLPADIHYVMTLDSDTKLTPGSVAKLAGKLSHPLNRPRLNSKSKTVRAGYGLLQPRVTPTLTEGDNASPLQQVFSGERGLDPYVFAVSDTYQDVAAEGTYTGKGLYHIDAFEAALAGRIKENRVLSHDLLEGGYARTAFVNDVEVVEDYPVSYYADSARRHRWIRGDWQLLPYIFGRCGAISAITRWKMLDNLRRSLTPPALILAFAGIWWLLPFRQAMLWQAALLLGLYIAPLLGLIRKIFTFDSDMMLRGHIRAVLLAAGGLAAHMLLSLSLLAHSAYAALDAICRTFYRMAVSRKHLLEWQSSDITKNLPKIGRLSAVFRMMLPAVLLAAALLIVLRHFAESGFYAGLPIIALWLVSPFIAWLISRPQGKRHKLRLSARDAAALRRAARRDWAFYEKFVTADNHYLPPDNFQEEPAPALAQRTSPTNIGLYLLSALAARDFGWISLQDMLDRIKATLHTLERLEKFRGHIYNWYATDTLKPLEPLYISTVDSGNLAGHLTALAAALRQWAKHGLTPLNGNARGISDNIDILAEAVKTAGKSGIGSSDRLKSLRRQAAVLRRQAEAVMAGGQTLQAAEQQAKLAAMEETAQAAAQTAADLAKTDKSASNSALCQAAAAALGAVRAHQADYAQWQKLQKAESRQRDLSQMLAELGQQARRLAFAMQFGFLENKERRLLSIGYRARENEADESCYDLLASEARLAVLFAIAKGDIKYEHWARLGRPLVAVGWKGAALSWSGSMFEYLMPPLIMQEPRGSLLDQTARLIVRRQMEYGVEQNLPWGISEAAFNARDPQMNYQYSAFGVPSLGLQRGLSRNRVIAPYATLLAAQYAPHKAVKNLKKLRKLGAFGAYGAYDSLDFTPSRVPQGQSHAVVRNYYAHHHGMAILAAANISHNHAMRRRFHSDAAIEAVELALQEKAPREIPVMNAKAFNPLRADTDRAEQNSIRVIERPIAAQRATLLLSGGAYSLMLTARGSGCSSWNGMAITRYQADAAEDQQGSFLFLRDCASGRWWSAAAEPTRLQNEEAKTVFTAEKAEFYKQTDGIHSVVECLACADAEGEGRRIKLFNRSHRDRIIEVISYSELALASPQNDAAHPAFSRLFIETETAPGERVIFARRRCRSAEEPPICAAHFVTAAAGEILSARAETDRRAFIGRGRSLRRPAFFDKTAAAEDGQRQSAGNFTLDPIFSLRCRLKIPAHKKAELVFWTMAADNRQKLEDIVARYQRAGSFEREFNAAWTRAQIIRHRIGLTPQDVSDYQKYATYLLYPEKQWQAPKMIAQNLGKQSDLWPMAISGDAPLCVLRISGDTDLPVAREMLRAHEYWQNCGFTADLALLNERPVSYAQDTQRSLEWLAEAYRSRARARTGKDHIFTLRKDQMSEESYRTLLASAQIMLFAGNGSPAEQLAQQEALRGGAGRQAEGDRPPHHAASLGLIARSGRSRRRQRAGKMPAAAAHDSLSRRNAGEDLLYWNGFGGFEKDGSYCIRLKGQQVTPQPWINIIANDAFGMHISAEGAPFTWAGNSRDYQLTPWSNDPVTNRPGEALYLVDLQSKKRFSPAAAAERDENAVYTARHGIGFSCFSAEHDRLASELIYTVDSALPLRFSRLRLSNRGQSSRSLRLYHYLEWVLGSNRAKNAPFLIPFYDKKRAAMLVSNPYSLEKPDFVSFVAAGLAPSSVSADRAEFIGAAGTVKHPQAVREGAALSGKAEAGGDSCAAMAYDINLLPGETKEIIFCLGAAENLAEAHHLLDYARLADFKEVLEKQKHSRRALSAGLQVETPDKSFNLLVNHWLPYQTHACRIQARAAFYQAGGAFGLRDQLQDTLALLPLSPKPARAQILAAAGRQFKEGDIQHWWLETSGAGVRSMIADDPVWLAYAAALYVTTTGETAFLDEEAPFLEGAAVPEGKQDSYFRPAISAETGSLYRHCCLALNLVIKRSGKNGLPLMLGGDWNDGLSQVGSGGKGESVWLGWFLGKVLRDFIPLAKARGDEKQAAAWSAHLQKLKRSLEKAGWDGAWYRRAFYDDGAPLGSAANDECRIDTIAQSWSIISGLAPPARQSQAFHSMLAQLYDREAQLIRLFWPPFAKSAQEPGYIKAYPPGIRENGGQYTHGALWSIIAAAQMGDAETAYALFSAVNPIHHGAKPELYRVEPYVAAADIYSVPPHRGRGGWTWYTGSAGWLYRAATEAILGLNRRGGRLFLTPCLPKAWKTARLQWRFSKAHYYITIKQSGALKQSGKTAELSINGKPADPAAGIALAKSGRHEIILTLAAGKAKAAAKKARVKKRKPAAGKRAAEK